jgi:hypothetical protein
MDEAGFRQHLKKMGKQPHVVEELVQQVQIFEEHLSASGQGGLETASLADLQEYADSLDARGRKIRMRGLALYFRFTGQVELMELAHALREQETARGRHGFKLAEFLGVEAEHIALLASIGISTTDQMLAAGATPAGRQRLEGQTGIPAEAILELVKLSDLARMEGVKGVRARLYYDAGLDTLDKFGEWQPEALRQYLLEWVERTGFPGIAPLPKEIRFTITAARQLPRVVDF